MRHTKLWIAGLALGSLLPITGAVAQQGDAEAGARAYRACAACHSLVPGRHLTGPSLAGIWGRKAGTVEGFTRYSVPLESAGVTWSEKSLDAWLAAPQAVVPGNRMTFRGVGDPRVRADLIAFLKTVGAGGAAATPARRRDGPGSPAMPDLRSLDAQRRVVAIRYCGDTYRVTTASGADLPIWEFNLRFKTDSSDKGPRKGRPALLRASMMGDRAFVIFADPGEISGFIRKRC